jgi:hypothetical protein
VKFVESFRKGNTIENLGKEVNDRGAKQLEA